MFFCFYLGSNHQLRDVEVGDQENGPKQRASRHLGFGEFFLIYFLLYYRSNYFVF